MNLFRLSGRRLALAWLIGATLEAALLFGSAALAMGFTRQLAPGADRQVAMYKTFSDRWKIGEAADAQSRERQLAESRLNGNYRLQSNGETLFAVVGVPSGRPDSLTVRARNRAAGRTVTAIAALVFGAIPLGLLIATTGWLLARTR